MKRIMFFMCLVALLAAGTSLKAQEVTITLMPGWTWISVPSTETMDFATALGSFTPAMGDRIKSQWGNATYRGNGEWRGQISEFYPGYGYMYYSARMVPVSVTFNAQQPSQQVVVTTDTPQFITAISAMGGGEVTTTDGTYIIVKGLCWATHENPTTNEDSFVEDGSGVGSFSATMTGLNWSTTYYVRAYAVTPSGTVYGEQQSFTTRDGIPTLTTDSITSITAISATCGGNITDDGGLSVTARGVCWSTSPNPTVSDSHTSNGTGTGSFTSSITNLEVSTTYYVRAYATTNAGTGYGENLSFTTNNGIPVVSTSSVDDVFEYDAFCGGIVIDDGGLDVTGRGLCWSTVNNPSLSDNHTTNGSGLGSFSSCMGGLTPSTTYYVRAYATNNYVTVYGNEVIFTTIEGEENGDAPIGAVDGLFSVSASRQVYFSRGNLRYQPSTNTWRFATNQFDLIHTDDDMIYDPEGWGNYCNVLNEYISTYSGWIDLFGWGTSGWNNGNTYYLPWDIYIHYGYNGDLGGNLYGPSYYSLTGNFANADWGVYNPISNGGNQSNLWRTLTKEEWAYVFDTRNTESGIRYAKAQVNNVNGVILLPDNWCIYIYSLSNTNNNSASFNSNVITADNWIVLEQAGAVFLPAVGLRQGEIVMYDVDDGYGGYWSSSTRMYVNSGKAYGVYFRNWSLNTQQEVERSIGWSVRLVTPFEN